MKKVLRSCWRAYTDENLLRMVALIFLLVPLILMQSGIFALYAVLFVYFLPWESVRQIGRQLKGIFCSHRA